MSSASGARGMKKSAFEKDINGFGQAPIASIRRFCRVKPENEVHAMAWSQRLECLARFRMLPERLAQVGRNGQTP